MANKITVDNYRRDPYDIEKIAGQDGAIQVVTSGLALPKYDYVAVTYPVATQEVYTFKTGGVSGTTVATITINYTDSTKENLSNVSRT